MMLTGAATFAEYEAAIALVRFTTSGDNVTNYGAATNRTISCVGQRRPDHSDPIIDTVTVTGINDAPVNTPGAAMNFTEDTTGNVGAEGVPPTPVGNAVTGISVFDVDANPATQDITVTLSRRRRHAHHPHQRGRRHRRGRRDRRQRHRHDRHHRHPEPDQHDAGGDEPGLHRPAGRRGRAERPDLHPAGQL